MCARHGAYYRQMAEDAHEGLRGATGPMWRERLTSELGNLRAALDWFIAGGDADAALSLASGMAWLWFINSDVVEGARWLGDALTATGPRRPELAATAQVWHGFCVCMAYSPAAAVPECDAALAALRTSDDQARRAEALLFCGTVLMRAQESERSLGALSEAHDLLEPAVHGWLLAVHDWIVAENLTLLGQFDDAEQAARSGAERFDAQGEVWMSVGPLSILAGIAAARGDLDGASAAYEALLERCRAAGQRNFVMFSLSRLAALRAKQGDDAAADGVYEEAIAYSFDPSMSADLMVGQAAVARRLGDLARARALLDAAGTYYGNVGLHAGQTGVLAGLAWWSLSAGQADDAMVFAADACQAAAASGDPAVQLLADTAVAAVRALADPTRPNAEAFIALAQQRAQDLPYGSLTSFTDGPDVAALAARLALPGR
jgi:tetratricopeptide (TPR) repeat protein